MAFFVLQGYLCYEYLAMCYEVFLVFLVNPGWPIFGLGLRGLNAF